MYGYICFYQGKKVEVLANTSYAAQTQAAEVFKLSAKNQHKVDVYLCERPDGSQVTQTITD